MPCDVMESFFLQFKYFAFCCFFHLIEFTHATKCLSAYALLKWPSMSSVVFALPFHLFDWEHLMNVWYRTYKVSKQFWILFVYSHNSLNSMKYNLKRNCYLSYQQYIADMTHDINGLVQERRNSSALAMELHLSCTNLSINWQNDLSVIIQFTALNRINILNVCQHHLYTSNTLKKIWSIIKEVIGKNKETQIQTEFKLSTGEVTSDKSTICKQFNSFFVNIGPTLSRSFDGYIGSPQKYLTNRQISSLFLSPVTNNEIHKILSSLNDLAPYIDGPFTYICNLSLNQGVFPDILEIANVIPLYKKEDPMIFSNYRPVSLLCSLSKVLEKIMYNRVMSFLNENDVLFKYQFGFRKSHSTYLALTVLMDKLIKSLENGNYVVGVFLDFSKAFDTVDHKILLAKLCHYGIRGSALDWFSSYLTNRKQFVTYNNERSELMNINYGVPQGSILGPLLFLIYINDLAYICKFTMPIFFANDSNLFQDGESLNEIESILNEELNEIVTWLKVNKLTLNVDKTQCMLFTRKKCNTKLSIKIENSFITQVTKTKFLGIIIDEKLNWKDHILYISNKISKATGVIIKARMLGKRALLSLYYSLVYPYLTYCCQVWGATYPYNIEILNKLQKKAIRIICSQSKYAHTEPLYKELKILDVKDIYNYLVGQFMLRNQNNLLPDVYDSYFIRKNTTHKYEIRHRYLFRIPDYKTNLGKRSIRYTGVKLWIEIMKSKIDVHYIQ